MLESLFTEKNAVTFLQIFSAVVCSLLAQSKEDNFLHYYYNYGTSRSEKVSQYRYR